MVETMLELPEFGRGSEPAVLGQELGVENKKEPLPTKRLLDESRPVGVCSIRRECLPNRLGAGYEGILATRRGDAGDGHGHRRRARVDDFLLLFFFDLSI